MAVLIYKLDFFETSLSNVTFLSSFTAFSSVMLQLKLISSVITTPGSAAAAIISKSPISFFISMFSYNLSPTTIYLCILHLHFKNTHFKECARGAVSTHKMLFLIVAL